MFLKRPVSLFDPFESDLFLEGHAKVRAEAKRVGFLKTEYWKSTVEKLTQLDALVRGGGSGGTISVDPVKGSVVVKHKSLAANHPLVTSLIETLHPWRKGPFQVNGTEIDAEWQSWIKWNRIAPHLPDLRFKTVADVGSNNGYYLFRLLACGAKSVVGFDPNDRFLLQYTLLQIIARNPNIFFEPLGIEDLDLFEDTFEVVLCLGVLYHRQNPLASLQLLKNSLRSGGTLFLESITIPEPAMRSEFSTPQFLGDDNELGNCLYVKDRYAQMRNVYFLPTPTTLAQWMQRVGFTDVIIIDESLTTTEEQRTTRNARFASLENFLDPHNPTKTIEGYPRPRRTIVKGRA